jgi:hypothetical protein
MIGVELKKSCTSSGIMQCAMWWPRIPTLEDIQDDLGDFAEHLTAPPGQFYNIKDEVCYQNIQIQEVSAARIRVFVYLNR